MPRSSLSDAEIIRRDNLAELLRLANEYSAAERDATAAGFESWLTATVGADSGTAGGDAVEVTTFHAAKGLEWPIVHVCGLESGLVPISFAKTQEAKDEERRLFYVATTRAEDALWLSWAAERTLQGRACPNGAGRRSSTSWPPCWRRWPPVRVPPTGASTCRSLAAALTGGAASAKTGRTGLDDPGDVALFDALKAWRLTRPGPPMCRRT